MKLLFMKFVSMTRSLILFLMQDDDEVEHREAANDNEAAQNAAALPAGELPVGDKVYLG